MSATEILLFVRGDVSLHITTNLIFSQSHAILLATTQFLWPMAHFDTPTDDLASSLMSLDI